MWLSRCLGSRIHHSSSRDSGVNVGLVAGTGGVRLQMLLRGATLRATLLQLVLSGEELIMEHCINSILALVDAFSHFLKATCSPQAAKAEVRCIFT